MPGVRKIIYKFNVLHAIIGKKQISKLNNKFKSAKKMSK